MTNRIRYNITSNSAKKISTQLRLAILAAIAAASACGHQNGSSIRSQEATLSDAALGTLLDCNGNELNTTPKSRIGDITIESHTFCNGLYAKDVVVVFNVPNLTPVKSVAFGIPGERLQEPRWLDSADNRDWARENLSIVYLSSTPDGRDRFALRKRHVGYQVPLWELRVSQGFTLQSIQF
jgi:hypothetical protein